MIVAYSSGGGKHIVRACFFFCMCVSDHQISGHH
jgi:hypothetical protein